MLTGTDFAIFKATTGQTAIWYLYGAGVLEQRLRTDLAEWLGTASRKRF